MEEHPTREAISSVAYFFVLAYPTSAAIPAIRGLSKCKQLISDEGITHDWSVQKRDTLV
jgi:hypothetical protein